MSGQAAVLAQALARHAEAVCRYYLSNGRRHGRYWLVGDINNTPGRSLYVRLAGPDYGPGAAGKWTDAATGEHGDLLDLIAANRGLEDFRNLCDEVGRFLSLPPPESPPCQAPAPQGSPEAARRLFRAGVSIKGTHAEAYLRARGITAPLDGMPLRFHPRLWYRRDSNSGRESWPGLLAAVTDARGRITGVHRTWLDRIRPDKAPLPDPRRALGHLLGNGVRFGHAELPGAGRFSSRARGSRPCCRSNPSCPACRWSRPCRPTISRRWNSRQGSPGCMSRRPRRGGPHGVRTTPRPWESRRRRGSRPGAGSGDFNEDLCRAGPEALLARLLDQLAPDDVLGFLPLQGSPECS